MTFASDLGSDCVECKRILERDGVAEGFKASCHQCPYGIRIVGAKRVYVNNSVSQMEKQAEKIAEKDRELED